LELIKENMDMTSVLGSVHNYGDYSGKIDVIGEILCCLTDTDAEGN
jgi:hypothetical protein